MSDEPGDLRPGRQRELVMLRDLSPERTVSDSQSAAARERAT